MEHNTHYFEMPAVVLRLKILLSYTLEPYCFFDLELQKLSGTRFVAPKCFSATSRIIPQMLSFAYFSYVNCKQDVRFNWFFSTLLALNYLFFVREMFRI